MKSIRLSHPDGSVWSAVPDGLNVVVTNVRAGATTCRTRTFATTVAVSRFLREGTEQMLKVGYAPLDTPASGTSLSGLRQRVAEVRASFVGVHPARAIPGVWALWTSGPFRENLQLLWKFGGIEGLLAPLSQAPVARDLLVRACVSVKSADDLAGWPADELALASGSPLLVPLLRLRVLERVLCQLEREVVRQNALPGWDDAPQEALPGADLVDTLELLPLAQLAGLELLPEWLDGLDLRGPAEQAWARLAPGVSRTFLGDLGDRAPRDLEMRAAEDEARILQISGS